MLHIGCHLSSSNGYLAMGKEALSLGFVAAARRVVLAEFLGREVGGDQRFRDERKIQINGHGKLPFPLLNF